MGERDLDPWFRGKECYHSESPPTDRRLKDRLGNSGPYISGAHGRSLVTVPDCRLCHSGSQ